VAKHLPKNSPQTRTTVTPGGLLRKTAYFTPDEWQALRQAAFDTEIPVSELIRLAVRKHLGLPPGPEIRPGPKTGEGRGHG
jgi:hypothetical protein